MHRALAASHRTAAPASAAERTPRGRGRRRLRGLSVAVLLVVLPAAALASTPTRLETFTEAESGTAHEWKPFDAYPVLLHDIDGDGRKEIIDHNDNKYVYVLSSSTGKVLAELTTKFPDGWGARTLNGVAAERMQPGYPVSLIVANSAAYVTRFDFNKSASNATDFVFDKKWEKRMDAYHSNPGMDAKAVLVDANKNGLFEIFVQTEEVGLYALKYDGSYLWKKQASGGNAEPVIADGDRDGHMEAYFFSDDGMVRVYDSLTGAFEWQYDAKTQLQGSASIPRGGTIAQLDDAGRWEVVFCARDAHDANNPANNHMGLFVLRNDNMDTAGDLVWMKQPSWAAPLCYTRPVVYDHNGNGPAEIYGMDWNTMGHNPGNWQRTGPAHVFSFNKDGQELWHTTLDSWWSNKDILIADFDGDAAKEILANGPTADGSKDGWWILDIATGANLTHLSMHPWKSSRAPRLGDVDGDGETELVFPVEGSAEGTTGGEGAFQLWDVGTSTSRVVWSGGEDGYPKAEPFRATFTPEDDSSTSHVSVKVESFHHVRKAWFRENEGPWQTLTRTSSGPGWGVWERDAEVPEGTLVRFKAEDDLGAQRVSPLIAWPPA